VRRLIAGTGIVLLIIAAAYSLFVAVRAALTADGYDPYVFWMAVAIFFVIAAVALWLALRMYRKHFSRPVW
jgi:hypothetical protein